MKIVSGEAKRYTLGVSDFSGASNISTVFFFLLGYIQNSDGNVNPSRVRTFNRIPNSVEKSAGSVYATPSRTLRARIGYTFILYVIPNATERETKYPKRSFIIAPVRSFRQEEIDVRNACANYIGRITGTVKKRTIVAFLFDRSNRRRARIITRIYSYI